MRRGMVGCLLALAACSGGMAEEPAASPEPPQRVELGYEAAGAATQGDVVNLPGAVVLPEDAQHALGPPGPVRLRRWLVAPGEAVTAGAPLAEAVPLEVGDLEAAAREQRAVLQSRSRLLEVVRGQVAAGVRPVDAEREAEVSVTEARGRLEALTRQQATRGAGLEGGVWRAPVSGVVSRLRCAPGSVQGPEAACVEVLEVGRAQVEVHLPERLEGRVSVGSAALLYPASGGAAVELRVVRQAPTLEPSSRTRSIYLVATSGGALAVGSSGRVRLQAPAAPGVVSVPAGAVTELDGAEVVFARRGEGAAAVPVRVEGRAGEALLVRGAGLEVGTPVVVRGVLQAKSAALSSP